MSKIKNWLTAARSEFKKLSRPSPSKFCYNIRIVAACCALMCALVFLLDYVGENVYLAVLNLIG